MLVIFEKNINKGEDFIDKEESHEKFEGMR